MNDTSPEADFRYHALLRRLSPAQRLEAAMRLSLGVREMAVAGIRRLHPGIGEEELRVRLTVRLYGPACAQKLFGWVPEDAI